MNWIVYGRFATKMERLACSDLQVDWQQVTGQEMRLLAESEPLPVDGIVFLVGCPQTSERVARLVAEGKVPITATSTGSVQAVSPGHRGGCIQVVDNMIVLAGCDAQGAQYAVYDFCRDSLGIDPFAYWTGYQPDPLPHFSLSDVQQQVIQPPHVPILCYFDNDNDELANLHEPLLEFSWEQWQALIDTLVRLKFNAVEPFDHFGRSEYFTREPYLKLRPDYQVNETLLNRLIDYAHDKGMLVQVSFGLGWHFKPISDEAADNWTVHKSKWLETWQYYLDHTPIGRCDIFANRPRHQKLDHPYRSSSGEHVVDVFHEVFAEMHRMVRDHNPEAMLIADLYSEGRDVFNAGFRPQPEDDYLLMWADDGYGRFPHLLTTNNGYRNGIYVHAGFWQNHVVQDPYPVLLASEMQRAILDLGADKYCLVNGQTFRHFILNLELCSAVCENPVDFDAATFFTKWVTRYFGKAAANHVVQIYNWLHEAQAGNKGYVELLWDVQIAQRRVQGAGERGEIASIQKRITLLEKALKLAKKTTPLVKDQAYFYHDQVLLPVRLLLQLNQFLLHLTLAGYHPTQPERLVQAIETLQTHTNTRLQGDNNQKWATWYSPAKARPNNGYPDIQFLKNIMNKHKG